MSKLSRDQIILCFKSVLKDVLKIEIDKISESADLRSELDLDSIDLFDCLVAIEEKLDIKLEGSKLNDLKTVGDFVDLIEATLVA